MTRAQLVGQEAAQRHKILSLTWDGIARTARKADHVAVSAAACVPFPNAAPLPY